MKIRSHSVPILPNGLSPMQNSLLRSERLIRLVSAPTGSGKSYAFIRSVIEERSKVLFIVPTKRLIQNLIQNTQDQAHYHLDKHSNLDEEKRKSWINERVIEWSGNQVSDGIESRDAMRVRQFLTGVGHSDGCIVFAIPEVVVHMISGIRIVGSSTINPFSYIRNFDHIVFDEFHTIDDRAFGLASFMALLSVNERQCRISLLSATPIDVTHILAKSGVKANEIERISEKIVDGHPIDHRPIHGNVSISLYDTPLLDLVEDHINAVKKSIKNGETVIIIYDSLRCLQREKTRLWDILKQANIGDECILAINSIDDSKLKQGESNHVKRFEDPSQYQVLVCTSSVEIGVTFSSTLMFMEPGFGQSSFVQRIGRVSRGDVDGQVIVSLTKQLKGRHAWTRKMETIIEQNDNLSIEDFTHKILNDVKREFETDQTSIDTKATVATFPYFRSVSWRGVFWAALFIVAIQRQKMKIQSGAQQHLRNISPGIVKYVDARIWEVLSVDTVNPYVRREDQPHRRWINALLTNALAYRDISSTIRVIDPNGDSCTVSEYYLRRATDILDRHPLYIEREEFRVNLISRTLAEETRQFSGHAEIPRVKLYVHSPIGTGDFEIQTFESELGTEQLYRRLITEWQRNFEHLLPDSEESTTDPCKKVIGAATALIERLGRPPLDRDFEYSEESAIFA